MLLRRDEVFVSTDWLAERLESPDVLPVDGSWYLPAMLRDGEPRNGRREFDEGHIPGAVYFDIDAISDQASDLPHMMPSQVAFASAMRKLGVSDGHTLVVYDGLGLFSAPRVWWMLRAMGARRVHLLDGGLPAWTEAGLPLQAGPSARTASHFSARFDASLVADLATVEKALAAKDVAVFDARPHERFTGDAPEPRPGVRAGHMPGARSLAFTQLIEDGRLKPDDELRAILAESGVKDGEPVITSCGSGVSAVTLALALMITGHRDVRVYDGSWAEWGSREDLPVQTGP
ncbi:MAG: 3-mercaptopyruvate sulfurtransferase [Devosiaceae bacterium]|nr:3-mercaptopyruvate sulfurtransferase [Devosiaceae bacterium MH13]